MSRRLVGGWWGASVACLAAKACCVCGLLSLFRASAQAKVPDPAARERLHPTRSGQARYVTDGDPIAKGAKDLEIPTINAWFQMYTVPLRSAKGWVRNADDDIEGESTTTTDTTQRKPEGKEKTVQTIGPRTSDSESSCPPCAYWPCRVRRPCYSGLACPPSAGRPCFRACPRSGLFPQGPGGTRVLSWKDKEGPRECLVWQSGP